MDAHAWLDAPVTAVDGVSRRAADMLRATFSVETVRDLLEHYPYQDKYRDIGAHLPLSEAQVGEPLTLVGSIARWDVIRPRPKSRRQPRRELVIAKATVVTDEGGEVAAPFFNQEWRPRRNPEGTRVAVSGTLERFRSELQVKNPKLTVLDDGQAPREADRIQATYPATESMPSHRLARYAAAALDALPPLPDFLPEWVRQRRGLVDLDTAVRAIHRPPRLDAVTSARNRLVYDELFCLQVGLAQRRQRLESEAVGLDNGPRVDGPASRFVEALPFPPTGAQQRAMSEIGADLAREQPMHRLLQGDVGSGKTLVAAWAMLAGIGAGRQAAVMAPTEVLAEQHLRTLTALLAPLGVNGPGGLRVELLTGATSAKRRRAVLAETAAGDVDLLVGTHALLEEEVTFADLGVVVVDEQHRFGVEHRTRLRDKRAAQTFGDDVAEGRTPDVLVMTATPIPRSLALTLYGDLDVTVLDELPPGRRPIRTQVIPADSPRRERLYAFIRERVQAGERAYVVCPLVADSDSLRVSDPSAPPAEEGGNRSVASAETTYTHLAENVFADLSVGLVHGRMPEQERDATMEAFRAGELDVLVATTVIEVGVDVPEATIMVIEDADRFGISQLHQLRGRVGRARAQSYCVLFTTQPENNPRLDAVAATTDGFRLAETDLELRGEGSLFDTRQSGLADLKLARLVRDADWVSRSRADAQELVADDVDLAGYRALRAEVARRFGEERLAALKTG